MCCLDLLRALHLRTVICAWSERGNDHVHEEGEGRGGGELVIPSPYFPGLVLRLAIRQPAQRARPSRAGPARGVAGVSIVRLCAGSNDNGL
jgi:hypothetical protein